MELPDRVLREMLVTQHWQQCYRYIMEVIEGGASVGIEKPDWSVITLNGKETALHVLREHYGMTDEAAA